MRLDARRRAGGDRRRRRGIVGLRVGLQGGRVVPTDRAGAIGLQPLVDAARVVDVVAGQRAHRLPRLHIAHADDAVGLLLQESIVKPKFFSIMD